MSPPGKRRHNELNAAPPPETPRRTGKPGAAADRDFVYSRESFRIRGKTCLLGEPRGTIPLCLPLEGKVPEGRMRCSAAARLCRQMLHFASLTEILSLRYRLSVFLSPEKEKLKKERAARGMPP